MQQERLNLLTYERENTVGLYHSFTHSLLVCTIKVKTTATSAFRFTCFWTFLVSNCIKKQKRFPGSNYQQKVEVSLPHRQWDVQSAELLGLFLEGKDPQLAFLPAAWCRRPVPLEKALPSLVWVIVYRPSPTPTCWLGWRYLAVGGGRRR